MNKLRMIKGERKMLKISEAPNLAEEIKKIKNKIDILTQNSDFDQQELLETCEELDLLINKFNKL